MFEVESIGFDVSSEGEEKLTGSHLKSWVDSDAKILQSNSEGSIINTGKHSSDACICKEHIHSLT